MNPLNFVADILKVLLVNLLAGHSELCQRFLTIKKRLENKKNVKKRKKRDQHKNVKNIFTSMPLTA